MRNSTSQDVVHGLLRGEMTRRILIQRLGVLGLSLTAIAAAPAPSPTGANVATARKEGSLVFWHTEQEADLVKFAKLYSDRYSVKTEWERLLPGKALP